MLMHLKLTVSHELNNLSAYARMLRYHRTSFTCHFVSTTSPQILTYNYKIQSDRIMETEQWALPPCYSPCVILSLVWSGSCPWISPTRPPSWWTTCQPAGTRRRWERAGGWRACRRWQRCGWSAWAWQGGGRCCWPAPGTGSSYSTRHTSITVPPWPLISSKLGTKKAVRKVFIQYY